MPLLPEFWWIKLGIQGFWKRIATEKRMARNSRILVRQLLGNPLNPYAALLHHHNHKHPLSFIKTLTVSVPTTPSLPPRPPPPAIPSSSKLFCTLDSNSKKEIIIGSYSRCSINYKGRWLNSLQNSFHKSSAFVVALPPLT